MIHIYLLFFFCSRSLTFDNSTESNIIHTNETEIQPSARGKKKVIHRKVKRQNPITPKTSKTSPEIRHCKYR